MSVYKFDQNIRGEDLDLYYEDANVAIDVTPNPEHERYRGYPRRMFPGYEVIMPVAEVENLITSLQTMVKTIRERFPDAA